MPPRKKIAKNDHGVNISTTQTAAARGRRRGRRRRGGGGGRCGCEPFFGAGVRNGSHKVQEDLPAISHGILSASMKSTGEIAHRKGKIWMFPGFRLSFIKEGREMADTMNTAAESTASTGGREPQRKEAYPVTMLNRSPEEGKQRCAACSGFDVEGKWIAPGHHDLAPSSPGALHMMRACSSSCGANSPLGGVHGISYAVSSTSAYRQFTRLTPLPLVRAPHISEGCNLTKLIEQTFGAHCNEPLS